MDIETVCQSKGIQSPGPLPAVVMVQFNAVDGHGNYMFYMTPEQAEEYKLGGKYIVSLKPKV